MKKTPLRRRGARAERDLEARREFHEALWKRCKGYCERCHRRVSLLGREMSRMHPHHITPKGKADPEWRHDPEKNGLAVCFQCHDWIHHQHPELAKEEGVLR